MLTISNLDNGRPNNVSSFNTNSLSPTNGDILLIAIGARVGGSSSNIPSVSGLGLTWTQIATQSDTSGTQGVRMTIFRAVVSGSPTGTITVSFGSQTQSDSSYSVEKVSGANIGNGGANAIVQSVGGSVNGGSQSLSLPALRSIKNIAYGAFTNGGSRSSIGSGFTSLAIPPNAEFLSEYKVNATTVNYTYTGPNDSCGIALEIAGAKNASILGAFL